MLTKPTIWCSRDWPQWQHCLWPVKQVLSVVYYNYVIKVTELVGQPIPWVVFGHRTIGKKRFW